MNRIPWWVWEYWWILAGVVIIVLAIVLNQWAYDGDLKCLVAECRRIKK